MKHIFVFNPFAGPGTVDTDSLRKKLEGIGVDFEIVSFLPEESITDFVLKRGMQSPDETLRFYACGGDGTIKRVADGVVKLKNAELSVYPIGSGNDFVKYYVGKESFLDLEALCNSTAHDIDIIKVGDEYSVNITNFGFEASVADTMSKVRRKKLIGGKNAYTTGIVKALFTAMKNRADIYVDGEKLNDGTFLLCTIGNSSYVGGSFKCAPRSMNDDGLLEVCCVKPIFPLRFFTLIGPYSRGEHLDAPKFRKIVTYRQSKKVEIHAKGDFWLSLDGELINQSDTCIEVIPGALRFAVPEN